MAIEFMPWYGSAEQMVRCAGDDGCGGLLMNGDAELHQQWHDKVWPHFEISINVPVESEPGEVARQVIEKVRVERRPGDY